MRVVEMASFAGICLAFLVAGSSLAQAAELTSDATASATANPGYYGQAVTTPAGASGYDDITFSWLNSGTPEAAGDLYILTSAYTGAPSGLSSAPYLAESISASDGVWTFSPSVVLSANTTYYFYSDSSALTITYDASGGASGGYFAVPGDGTFVLQSGLSQDFILSGQSAPVPEPSSVVMLAGAVTALAAARRRKASTK
jgi:hypothetical protein